MTYRTCFTATLPVAPAAFDHVAAALADLMNLLKSNLDDSILPVPSFEGTPQEATYRRLQDVVDDLIEILCVEDLASDGQLAFFTNVKIEPEFNRIRFYPRRDNNWAAEPVAVARVISWLMAEEDKYLDAVGEDQEFRAISFSAANTPADSCRPRDYHSKSVWSAFYICTAETYEVVDMVLLEQQKLYKTKNRLAAEAALAAKRLQLHQRGEVCLESQST